MYLTYLVSMPTLYFSQISTQFIGVDLMIYQCEIIYSFNFQTNEIRWVGSVIPHCFCSCCCCCC